jgi:hypothetical protein
MNTRTHPAHAGLLLALAFVLVQSQAASAQAWDAPSFFSPRPGEDLGIYAVRPDGQGDWGYMAIWRTEGNLNLGVRAGYLDGGSWMVGAEFHNPVDLFAPGTGLVMSWVLGAGASFRSGWTQARVPFGISLGADLGTPDLRLMPYVHPRVALDLRAYDLPGGQERTETDVRFDVDVGADAVLGESLVLRVGATIGDRNTFGVGIAYRLGRRLVVR